MRNIGGAGLFYMAGDGDSLYHPLCANAQRVGGILQDIAIDQVFYTALIIFLCHIHTLESGNPEAFGTGLYLGYLLLAESAGIHCQRMYLKIFYLLQVNCTVGSV